MNLLKETIEKLKEHNLTPKDVRWVGSKSVKTSWDNFAQVSDVQYDHGYGAPEVATNLVIVGKDWWLERHEYDGAEGWEFKALPEEPVKQGYIGRLVGGTWDTLEELNPPEEK